MKREAVLGMMLILLLTSMLTLLFNIQPAKASGTIYIRADGSVEGTDKIQRDGDVYTFTGNIYDSLVVERDNIVVDGAGYTVQGTGGGYGIDLSYRNNVTLKNVEVTNFWAGIYLWSSINNVLSGNTASSNNQYGILLYYSSNNNVLAGNTASNNSGGIYLRSSSNNNTLADNTASNNHYGIILSLSSNNTLTGNNASNNQYNFGVWGTEFYRNNYVDTSNTVDGKPIYYLIDEANVIIDAETNAGTIYLINSNNITIKDLTLTKNWCGAFLWNTTNSKIENVTASNNLFGIVLGSSSDNVLFHNDFIDNTVQADVWIGYVNTWDDGYPSGGNYWSDYTGVDVKSGPNQDQPSSDGIGDTPHIINTNNRDRYPLMYPLGTLPPPSYTLAVHSSPTGVTFTVDGVSRTTPLSGTYTKDASVSLVMPETHDGYIWSHWLEDGDLNRIKTVTMDTNITLTAVFKSDTTPPSISIVSPENKTYPVEDVPLTFTVSESTSWMGYSLDGQTNVTISGNTTIVGLSDGIHTITVYANDTDGNMGSSDTVYFTIDTVPPNIEILSPENKTYPVDNVPLTFTISEPASWMGYSLDGQLNATVAGNTTLSGLSDGSHSLIVYANDTAGIMGYSDIVYFTVDTIPPIPEAGMNQTVDEDTVVTLDGSNSTDNVEITSYTWTFTDVITQTLTGVTAAYTFETPGVYTVTLNATDVGGNWNTDTVVITVLDVTDPVAEAGLKQTVVEDTVVSFDAGDSSDNVGIVSFDWDFGDENKGTGVTTTHTYTEPGNYTVTLTVKDAAGNDDTDSIVITVLLDTDKDGTPDITDPDDDNDGVNDNEDAFPLDPAEWIDTDEDGIGNNADTDDDNDGVPDATDAFPLDPTETVDTDGDGTGNNVDTDDDNDGIPDTWEIENGLNPLDAADASLDPDGDGLTSLEEYQQGTDPNVSDAEPPPTEPTEGFPLWAIGVAGAVTFTVLAVALVLWKRKGTKIQQTS